MCWHYPHHAVIYRFYKLLVMIKLDRVFYYILSRINEYFANSMRLDSKLGLEIVLHLQSSAKFLGRGDKACHFAFKSQC